MSDEQVQALMQNWRDELKKQMDAMTLRKWCIEQSIEFSKAGRPFDPEIILRFVTAPFSDAIKE